MKKLERLGRRLHPRPQEDGERSKPANGLRWSHKVFLVPVFALAMFAVGLVATPEAQADSLSFECYEQYGKTWYDHELDCYWHNLTNDTFSFAGSGTWYWVGYWIFDYYPTWDQCRHAYWTEAGGWTEWQRVSYPGFGYSQLC
jgi:hypothetical protein